MDAQRKDMGVDMVQSTDYRPNLGSHPGTQISSINYGPEDWRVQGGLGRKGGGRSLKIVCSQNVSEMCVYVLILHRAKTEEMRGLWI